MTKKQELSIKQMETALEMQEWLWENVLGDDFETQDYIFQYHGGEEKFWDKWVWDKIKDETN